MGNHTRLAGTRAREQQYWAIYCLYTGSLLRIHIFKKTGQEVCSRVGGRFHFTAALDGLSSAERAVFFLRKAVDCASFSRKRGFLLHDRGKTPRISAQERRGTFPALPAITPSVSNVSGNAARGEQDEN
jgi:hypothetical protein